MKNAFIILGFTVLVTLFYRHVGQLVPQKEVAAPKEEKVTDDLSTEQMIEVGRSLVEGRCMSCHGIQPRFPDLKGVGARASSRREGFTDVDYFAESLYEPNAFIVEPFSAGMTPANKPPINLGDKEILCVIAYLQSLGGTPSVTMATKLKYQGSSPAPTDSAAPPAGGGGEELTGDQISAKYGCTACHSFDKPDRLVGPTLFDVGKRLSKAEIYEAVMDPDAVVGADFVAMKGMMGATLGGAGFYTQVNSGQLKKLVDYLSELKGAK